RVRIGSDLELKLLHAGDLEMDRGAAVHTGRIEGALLVDVLHLHGVRKHFPGLYGVRSFDLNLDRGSGKRVCGESCHGLPAFGFGGSAPPGPAAVAAEIVLPPPRPVPAALPSRSGGPRPGEPAAPRRARRSHEGRLAEILE